RIGDSTFGNISKPMRLRHFVEAQVVVLEEIAALGDVGDERVEPAAVVCITKRCRHAAFGFALETSGSENESFAAIVEIQLFRTVVVGDIDVRPAVVVEVGRRGGKSPSGGT